MHLYLYNHIYMYTYTDRKNIASEAFSCVFVPGVEGGELGAELLSWSDPGWDALP